MLERFTDHAANERTFLAWIRTAITVMTLGFVLERFDVVLALLRGMGANVSVSPTASSRTFGLLLIGAGAVMTVLGAVRFNMTRAAIDHPSLQRHHSARIDLAFSVVMAVLACALAIYLSQALTGAAS